MLKLIHGLLRDESGATVIEYGVILGLVSVAIFGALVSLGISDQAMYNHIAAKSVAAMGG